MPRLVVVSLVLLILLSYAMFFASWNQQTVKVVGLEFGDQQYWDEVPVAYLPLAGVAAGVLAMAIASLLHWQDQREAQRALSQQVSKLTDQVRRAREVIEQQKQRIAELEAAQADAQTPSVPAEAIEVVLHPAPPEQRPSEPRADGQAAGPSPAPLRRPLREGLLSP